MEVDEIHRKFARISGGAWKKLGQKMDDEEDEAEKDKRDAEIGGALGRFYGWPSSRIVRVSRASGGKDRHSKVLTSKGLRDRRVRLSVNTAIQFYDLQDRLGYDQPSKAVEWLLKAAADSVAELPPISTPFPDTPRQLSDEKRSSTAGSDHLCFDSAEVDMDPKFCQAAKSSGAACSSTSETSKGSGVSLSRSESRIKARERAKGRVAEKEKESESSHVNPISTSFTELLNEGINSSNHHNHHNNNDVGNNSNQSSFFPKSHSPRHWSSTPMDYFASGLLGGRLSNPFTFGVAAEHHQPEVHQNFSSLSDLGNHNHNHNNQYNLNFTISPSSAENSSGGLAGFPRGTLQSNSASPQLPQFQRYNNNNDDDSNPDGSTLGFYIGTAASVENHHHHQQQQQLQSGYDSRLQLCYGDDAHGNTPTTTATNNGSRHSGEKG